MVICLDSVLLLLLCGLQVAYDAGYDTANTRGRVMIIANHYFNSLTLTNREGTSVDVRELSRVFRWLNFEVVVHNNLMAQVSYTHLFRFTDVINAVVIVHKRSIIFAVLIICV